jgi:teichuronic acid biosynthesis glycosyltransferase TuaG
LLAGNVISTSCALIRNDKTEFFNENMRYAEDYDLWLRIAYRYGAYLADVHLTQLFRPITSAGGISSNIWQMRIGEMKAYAGFATQNPIFLFLLPLLFVSSLLKHLLKMTGML